MADQTTPRDPLSVPPAQRVAFQGEAGAYSHLACQDVLPDKVPLPCPTFEDAFEALQSGMADLAMIPIENSLWGRVADIHHLLPTSGLFIIGEHFHRVRHQLMGLKGTKIDQIKMVMSHAQALGQCRETLRRHGLTPHIESDTAGSARLVAERGDPMQAAIASRLAAELYGLEILMPDVQDDDTNTTRFVILSRTPQDAEPDSGPTITSFVFKVRNIPGSLYKSLGGFATNGINLTKLESYQLDGSFLSTQFYADLEGHPSEPRVQLAMQELAFFTREVKVLGVYPAHPFRSKAASRT